MPDGPRSGPSTSPAAGSPDSGEGADIRRAIGYPAHLEVDERLRDGSIARFRPILPTDGDALVDFHDGLSPQSVYRRFFFTHPHLTKVEVDRFTHVDYVERLAFAVLDGERIIGVGRYERLPPGPEAEVAFVVTDDHQHLGIGTLLLDHLADAARVHGVERFVAQTLSENREMLGVFLSSGFPVETSASAGTVTIRFPIETGETYLAARASRRDPTGVVDPPLPGRPGR
jgi:GNAT superfamily N-acetyltransferase